MATAERETPLTALTTATVPAAFQVTAAACADRVALRTRGDAITVTWAEYADGVRAFAAGLAGLGVRRGDTVATMLTNRPEFHVVDMAAMHLGAVPFGLYNTSAPADIVHRLTNADTRVVITQQSFLPSLRAALADHDAVDHVIVVDGPADGAMTVEDVERAASQGFDFEANWRAVEADDLATIIYTSGTTGPPKGAQWSHRNVMAQMRSVSEVSPIPRRLVSYLPFAHAGERMMSHYMSLGRGATITCCPDHREVLLDIIETRPDVLMSVPRMWVKLKGAIKGDLDRLEDEDLRARLLRTLAVGEERVRLTQERRPVPAELVSEHEAGLPILKQTALAKYGMDAIEYAIIGSAPPPADVLYFFQAVGVPLVEAYGLTESSFLATTARNVDEYRLGYAGRPIPGVELKLDSDGEILLRGETMMVGYRKQPEETAKTFTADGWLRTGDIGELDDEGNVKIIDRKKQLIITDTGKNVSPAVIERAIQSKSPIISHCVAIGDGRPHIVGLIVLDPAELELFARARGLQIEGLAEAAQHPEVLAEVASAVERGNAQLSRAEAIRAHAALGVEWLPDTTELTPTAKVKRRDVQAKYAETIAGLYA